MLHLPQLQPIKRIRKHHKDKNSKGEVIMAEGKPKENDSHSTILSRQMFMHFFKVLQKNGHLNNVLKKCAFREGRLPYGGVRIMSIAL